MPKCAQCGMPLESSKCRHCGYSGAPLKSCIYGKVSLNRPEKPKNVFESEFSVQGILPKLAILSLIIFVASLWTPVLRSASWGSFLAFLLFSIAYGFLRMRS